MIGAVRLFLIPWCFKIHRMFSRVDDSAYFPFAIILSFYNNHSFISFTATVPCVRPVPRLVAFPVSKSETAADCGPYQPCPGIDSRQGTFPTYAAVISLSPMVIIVNPPHKSDTAYSHPCPAVLRKHPRSSPHAGRKAVSGGLLFRYIRHRPAGKACPAICLTGPHS